ncbi:MAG: hypothetical protein J5813_05590 [Candidatus Methanomethylophilaceae archaeon]|nr:hypothetical protein [Candidatus Methanomethylophilaceae archaeon]
MDTAKIVPTVISNGVCTQSTSLADITRIVRITNNMDNQFFKNTAVGTNEDIAPVVCPLGHEYPFALTPSTLMMSGSRSHGRGCAIPNFITAANAMAGMKLKEIISPCLLSISQ